MAEILVDNETQLTLNAQLSDGDLSLPKVVKALVKDPNANVISETILAHIGDGLFLNTNLQMPEVPYLTAQYLVFNPDGVTRDYSYTVGLNVFRNTKFISLGSGSSGGGKSIQEIVAEIDSEQQYIVEVTDVSN
jgi:hypothetical protein